VSAVTTKWPLTRLGDICEFKYGKSLPETARAGGDISVFGSNGIVGAHNSALTNGPTIVIGRKGSHGEVNFSPASCWPIDTTYYVDRSATKADVRWLFHRLCGAGLNQMNRAAAVPGLNREDAYRVEILLPTLEEQRRIAAILDQAETLRTQRRTALALLDSLTQSLFLDMFGDPAINQKGWEVKTIEELCEVKGGKRLPKGAEYSPTPTPHRYIRVTNLSNGQVDQSQLLYLTPEIQKSIGRYIVNTGDVIISIAGSIGLVAPVPASLDGANLTENAAKLVQRRDGNYLPDFLAFMLGTKAIQDQIQSHVGQVTIGKLALFRIEKLTIPLPPLPLQQTFATRIASIEALKATHRHALAALDALFASLQQRAFAGAL